MSNNNITLTFTPAEVRSLITSCGSDRLAVMLLDKIIPDSPGESPLLSVLAELMASVKTRKLLYCSPFASDNKVFWLRELREASRNNNKILDHFYPGDFSLNVAQGRVLSLEAAKDWVENNAQAIDEELRL